MNVLFLIDSLNVGGAEKSLLEITSRFTKYRPVFILLFPGTQLKPQFLEAGIQIIELNCKPGYDFKKLSNIVKKSIEEIEPVIIHSTLFKADMVARELKKDLKIPLINSLVNNSYSKHRFASLNWIDKLKLFIVELWDRGTASRVDLFVSNSITIKNTNGHALKIPPEKIKVIYRGRAANDFEHPFELRSDHKMNGKKIFLNVSRLLQRKGQSDLLRAFKIFHSKYEDCILLIAGEGGYRKILEKEIDSLDLNDCVQLLGNREDVPQLLKKADFFVFSSHYEGLPGALIEAMLAKIPIIASDIPENMECVNSQNALIYRSGSVEELSKRMSEALYNDRWPEFTQNAYSFAKKNFEISKIAYEYENLYDQILLKKINTL